MSERAELLERLRKAIEADAQVISISKGEASSLLEEIARLQGDARHLREWLAPREVELSQSVVSLSARVATLEEALRWIKTLDKDENAYDIDERCGALLRGVAA